MNNGGVEEQWAGSFGDQYHTRNRVDWRKRIKFWSEIMEHTGARSVYEWGCGPGWNLSAIKAAVDWDVDVAGCEINDSAKYQAMNAGLTIYELQRNIPTAELTFTVGALIHVPPDKIKERMKYMIDLSYDYVLSVEYEDDTEIMVPYRGYDDMLWRRPYGKMYQDLGLKMVSTGGAGNGFDNCTFSLLRKP